MKKYKIVNRKKYRIFKIFAMSLMLISMLTLSLFVKNNISVGSRTEKDRTIEVVYGDTLWSIAREEIEKQKLKVDIREYIYEIKKLNNLKTSYLLPGKDLVLPNL